MFVPMLRAVIVIVFVWRCGTALAIDPARITVEVVLFLPDRNAMLYFVDDVATGGKRLVPVRSAHADPHCQLADRERADPVHTGRLQDGKAPARLLDDALTFLDRERCESLVFETRDDLPFVVIANPALEGGKSAGAGIRQRLAQRAGVEGPGAEAKSAHPPATGGMNTTESRSRSGADQSANSEFTATLSCSLVSANG